MNSIFSTTTNVRATDTDNEDEETRLREVRAGKGAPIRTMGTVAEEEEREILPQVQTRLREVRAVQGANVKDHIPHRYVLKYRTESLRDYELEVSQFDILSWDATVFLNLMIPKTRALILRMLEVLEGQKDYMTLAAQYSKPSKHGETIYTGAYHTSRAFDILNAGDIDEALDQAIIKILVDVEKFQRQGSGWQFDRCEQLNLHISKYQPFRGRSYFETPKNVTPKKSTNTCSEQGQPVL